MSIIEQAAALDWDASQSPSLLMTAEEFDNWHDELLRGEWVDGEVQLMSPASNVHIQLQMLLSHVIYSYCSVRGLGEVRGPEFIVRFSTPRRRRMPDLLFVALPHVDRIQPTYLDGPPDAIFEIVSPDSVRRDWRDKYLDYERAGVGEYWIIDPLSEVVEAYGRRERGSFESIVPESGRLTSGIIAGFFLKPEWLWQRPLPSPFSLLRELGLSLQG